MNRYKYHIGALALGSVCIAAPAHAAVGDSLWKFYSDFAVTVVEPAPGFTGSGSLDLLVGSQDDSLYLVETKGAGAGQQAWSSDLKATVSSAAVLPDINGDSRPDAVAGDELGLVAAVSGANGKAIWKFLTFGTVLSLAALPDVNGDGVADVAMGSEDDTVYCLSGKPGSALGKSLWEFALPPSKPGHPAGPPAKIAAPPSQLTQASGANSLALIGQKNKAPLCLAVGTNNDTVYCLGLADGAVKWKSGLAGDIWKVIAFPDQDGDGVEELLLACGADLGYLLNGATGAVIWTHAVTAGATAVAVAPDMSGDGKPDALIGDGNGTIHCVPGNSKGTSTSAWMYSFGDGSTITSIAVPGDLDKDGRSECVVGTSNDSVALIDGKGKRLWVLGLGGQVNVVAAPGDLNGDTLPDWVAGAETGFAQAFSGAGATVGLIPRAAAFGPTLRQPYGSVRLFARPGSGAVYDGGGRVHPPARGSLPAEELSRGSE
jgi:hypothetical protein